MKRAAVLALLALALAGGGWYWYQSRNGDAELRYRVAKVERGPLAAVVVASGTLNAVTTVQVGSQISGQVKEIFADFNTAVKKDQVIAQIDPSTFELRVNQARADLDSAEGAVAVARAGMAAQQAEVARVRLTLAEAQRDVDALLHQVDAPFCELDVHLDLRVALEKAWQRRNELALAEGFYGVDAQQAFRPPAEGGDLGLGLLDVGDDSARALEICGALGGERQLARSAVDEAHAEPVF